MKVNISRHVILQKLSNFRTQTEKKIAALTAHKPSAIKKRNAIRKKALILAKKYLENADEYSFSGQHNSNKGYLKVNWFDSHQASIEIPLKSFKYKDLMPDLGTTNKVESYRQFLRDLKSFEEIIKMSEDDIIEVSGNIGDFFRLINKGNFLFALEGYEDEWRFRKI